MRFFAVLTVIIALATGCAKNKSPGERTAGDFAKPAKTASAKSTQQPAKTEPEQAWSAGKKSKKESKQPVMTPVDETSGRVAMVNASAKFAVLTFPLGNIPAPGQQLSLYRNGLKVAEVKVTGPQRDVNTVADVIAGDAQPDDEVRKE